mmetsp:Transcript_7313/g.25189  ORF Transcript_7313/g.25189 Transcript_7313/m.25189 type:complete len:292 (+) Transcript_7313:229-1104(+)
MPAAPGPRHKLDPPPMPVEVLLVRRLFAAQQVQHRRLKPKMILPRHPVRFPLPERGNVWETAPLGLREVSHSRGSHSGGRGDSCQQLQRLPRDLLQGRRDPAQSLPGTVGALRRPLGEAPHLKGQPPLRREDRHKAPELNVLSEPKELPQRRPRAVQATTTQSLVLVEQHRNKGLLEGPELAFELPVVAPLDPRQRVLVVPEPPGEDVDRRQSQLRPSLHPRAVPDEIDLGGHCQVEVPRQGTLAPRPPGGVLARAPTRALVNVADGEGGGPDKEGQRGRVPTLPPRVSDL